MPEKILVPDGNEMWSTSKAIAPFGNNNRDDVALIQTMLKIFMTSPAIIDDLPASERAEINRIFESTVASGGKFADGIYGANTRAAVGILERRIRSPVKDGIVRPIFEVDRMGRTSGLRNTKIRELNDIWDANAITESAASKRESGRQLLPPDVFAELYPDG
jgi:peptidoglycan hydrolase-like protein with peptidoglycan-binding domain